jgi:hypothetical protein
MSPRGNTAARLNRTGVIPMTSFCRRGATEDNVRREMSGAGNDRCPR